MKVFIGYTNNAGVLTNLKSGFQKMGIKADFYSFNSHLYGYKKDRIISFSKNVFIRKFQKVFLLLKLLLKYDLFIFDTFHTLLPGFKDVKFYKFFGKKTAILFTGCDVRMPEKVASYKWNPCFFCNDDYKNFVGCNIGIKQKLIPEAEKIFDFVFCPQEAAGFLQKEYNIIYFPFNIEEFAYSPQANNKKLTILHAPSNEIYKGTKYIAEAIDKLKKKYDFNFKIVKNVEHDILLKEIEQCDLVIDQMLVGFYGIFSVEAMAMGKSVICYIREDIWNDIKEECPVYNANPDNLYDVLEMILKNPGQLIAKSIISRKYAEEKHASGKIAMQFVKAYEKG
jgi:glycosyltransferase involved in cell wall biosynthesis